MQCNKIVTIFVSTSSHQQEKEQRQALQEK